MLLDTALNVVARKALVCAKSAEIPTELMAKLVKRINNALLAFARARTSPIAMESASGKLPIVLAAGKMELTFVFHVVARLKRHYVDCAEILVAPTENLARRTPIAHLATVVVVFWAHAEAFVSGKLQTFLAVGKMELATALTMHASQEPLSADFAEEPMSKEMTVQNAGPTTIARVVSALVKALPAVVFARLAQQTAARLAVTIATGNLCVVTRT